MKEESPLARYESFLIHNLSTIGTIESSLRSLTWFLPGRFKDADLASELLTALLNLMSLYHDTLLARRLVGEKIKPLIPPSDHSRYTRAWTDKRQLYKYAARSLEIIRYLQLVVEMGLRKRFSAQAVWKGVIALETIKLTLRLVILRITQRPLPFPTIPERDIDPNALEEAVTRAKTEATVKAPRTPEHIKNNRVIFPLTPPSEPSPLLAPASESNPPEAVDEFLLSKALTPAAVRSPTSLLRPLLSPREWFSEILYISRPLVYVVALAKSAGSEIHGPMPLIISASFDLLSRYFRRSAPSTFPIERAEYSRRDREMLWYLFRDQVWRLYTRPKLSGIVKKAHQAPVLGLFAALLKDWIPLIDEYYYYTSV